MVLKKRTRSQKPKLSTIKRGHHMDGWPLCTRLCARPEISPKSNSVQIHIKSPPDEAINRSPPCVLVACKNVTYAR